MKYLTDSEVIKRYNYCVENSLCFITLKPLKTNYKIVEHSVVKYVVINS